MIDRSATLRVASLIDHSPAHEPRLSARTPETHSTATFISTPPVACDYLRHLAETYRERAQVAAQVGARGSAATAGAEEPERSEHELKEERRREREAEAKAER